jgi:hypothetical protein
VLRACTAGGSEACLRADAPPREGEAPVEAEDPMVAALAKCPRGYQDIRALPLAAGGAAFFSHRVIHWGSAGRPGHPTPRVACSWAATADDYERPYFDRALADPTPPLGLRAALLAGQMLNYNKRFAMHRHELALYNRVFMAQA